MGNFELRKDRFDFFESFEKPQLNITLNLVCPDFLTYCKQENIPPFHFFLFCFCEAIKKVENFSLRIYKDEVIKIDTIMPSYTVLNKNNDVNFTKIYAHSNMDTFISESLIARDNAIQSEKLLNIGSNDSEREQKNAIFITSLPWFDYSSIDYPICHFKSADIPSFAWGKFTKINDNKIKMPFSVQAHHGFVDGYHIHLLMKEICSSIENNILFPAD